MSLFRLQAIKSSEDVDGWYVFNVHFYYFLYVQIEHFQIEVLEKTLFGDVLVEYTGDIEQDISLTEVHYEEYFVCWMLGKRASNWGKLQ